MTQKVRGTQPQKPEALEFGIDTVYKRTSIVAVSDDNFTGWEYDEQQFTYPEYVKVQQEEMTALENAIVDLSSEIGGV